jgi:hypothetical protein
MAAFEHLYEAWLEAKQLWFNEQDVTAQSYGVASERLDYASCRLIEVLQARSQGRDYDYFSDQNPGDEL